MSVEATRPEPERLLHALALVLLVGAGAVFAVRGHRLLAVVLVGATLIAWRRADRFGLWRAAKDWVFVGYLAAEIAYVLVVKLGSTLISLGVVCSLTAEVGPRPFDVLAALRRLEPIGWVTLFFFYVLLVARNLLDLWAYHLGATETEPAATIGGLATTCVRGVVHLSAHLAAFSGLAMASGLTSRFEPLFIGSLVILLPTLLLHRETGFRALEGNAVFYTSLFFQLFTVFLVTTFGLGILFWVALTARGEPDLGRRLFWGLSGISALLFVAELCLTWSQLETRKEPSTFVPRRPDRSVPENPPAF